MHYLTWVILTSFILGAACAYLVQVLYFAFLFRKSSKPRYRRSNR
jgi:hypothetical protein